MNKEPLSKWQCSQRIRFCKLLILLVNDHGPTYVGASIDVLHPKWLLLEVHRYEVEVAQDSWVGIRSWLKASCLRTSSNIILKGFGLDWKDAQPKRSLSTYYLLCDWIASCPASLHFSMHLKHVTAASSFPISMMLVFPINTDWVTWSDLFLEISLHCPGAPGGLSVARMVVSQESFLHHFPAKQGNPWRNDDILEALADFGIEALLGRALIDFSSLSSFSTIWQKMEKRMSTVSYQSKNSTQTGTRMMNEVNHPGYQM